MIGSVVKAILLASAAAAAAVATVHLDSPNPAKVAHSKDVSIPNAPRQRAFSAISTDVICCAGCVLHLPVRRGRPAVGRGRGPLGDALGPLRQGRLQPPGPRRQGALRALRSRRRPRLQSRCPDGSTA